MAALMGFPPVTPLIASCTSATERLELLWRARDIVARVHAARKTVKNSDLSAFAATVKGLGPWALLDGRLRGYDPPPKRRARRADDDDDLGDEDGEDTADDGDNGAEEEEDSDEGGEYSVAEDDGDEEEEEEDEDVEARGRRTVRRRPAAKRESKASIQSS